MQTASPKRFPPHFQPGTAAELRDPPAPRPQPTPPGWEAEIWGLQQLPRPLREPEAQPALSCFLPELFGVKGRSRLRTLSAGRFF